MVKLSATPEETSSHPFRAPHASLSFWMRYRMEICCNSRAGMFIKVLRNGVLCVSECSRIWVNRLADMELRGD